MKFVKSGLVAGVVLLVVSTIFSFVFQALFGYNVLSLPGIRSVNDPVMLLFFLTPFVLGLVMAFAYEKFKVKNAFEYALVVWLLYALPSAFVVFTSMNYPIGFSLEQLIGGAISILASAVVIEKMQK